MKGDRRGQRRSKGREMKEAEPKHETAAEHIQRLADEHGIVYRRSALDDFADAATRLAGDEVMLDETQRLLIALSDHGLITGGERMALNIRYMRETAATTKS